MVPYLNMKQFTFIKGETQGLRVAAYKHLKVYLAKFVCG
jgi:hypothetical protein